MWWLPLAGSVGCYVDYMSFILLEIHLVEEVPDQDADGAVHCLYCARIPAAAL